MIKTKEEIEKIVEKGLDKLFEKKGVEYYKEIYIQDFLDKIHQIRQDDLNAIKEMIEKDLKLNGSRTLLSVEIVKETLQKLDNLN
ncbi:MAG: hypothetical protein U0354_21000 [Candidatus Sericytochromatia bacterium]